MRGQNAVRCLLMLALCWTTTLAGQDHGRSVVVLYNRDVPASRELAEHYAERRSVPASHLVGLALPQEEVMGRDDYLQRLETPLLRHLVREELWTFARPPETGEEFSRKDLGEVTRASVRYAVLCQGVPLKIREDPSLQEPAKDQLAEPLQRNRASVDSQLAALPMVAPAWHGMVQNPAYAATNRARLHPTNGILMVARLDGPTPEIARGLVDKALEAEAHGLWGRGYFDARGITNGNLQLGDDWIRNAQKLVSAWGFATELDNLPATFGPGYVMSDVALYAGWYASHASGPFRQARIDFRPGAFAYHLHSFSAETLRSTDQNWAGPLLHRGATATVGYVYEPYLTGTIDLPVFFGRWLFGRFTLGEAAWAAGNALSWQTVVVGDPLYRPVLKPPQQLHGELTEEKSPLLAWSHLLIVNRNEAMKASWIQLAEYLEGQAMTRTNAVLTEKLGDLYWAGKKFTDALAYYDLALERNPSRLQRLRMLLKLGHLRRYYGPAEKAMEYFQTALEDYPDYPDPARLYENLLPLARELGKPDLAEEYEAALKRLER